MIGDLAVPVTGVYYDSRAVTQGGAFFCVPGFVRDGHDFIPDALARGASVLVVEGAKGLEAAREVTGLGRPLGTKPGPAGAPVVVAVPNVRAAMGLAAANFFGHPSRDLRVIGVTGTNGKTTTTHLIREILLAHGHPCGIIGTVHSIVGGKSLPAGRTTPEAFDLQALSRQMVEAGDTHLAMEVGSHALVLDRVKGFEFDLGVFTNLTQDHLDFHGDLESYFLAKAKLFERLGSSYAGRPKAGTKAAILNANDPYSARLTGLTRVPVVTYGIAAREGTTAGPTSGTPSDAPPFPGPFGLEAQDIKLEPGRATFTIRAREGLGAGLPKPPAFTAPAILSLTGAYNVSNALAALAVALVEGVPPLAAVEALAKVKGAPGRFETVEAGQDFLAVVDYAHTPDGLENVLQAARALHPRRIITVFGCGGDRDRRKRPLMGKAVAALSDFCVVTSDNPRSEKPEAIIEEIKPGLLDLGRREGVDFIADPDRARAIGLAVKMAEPGDLVLVAGKGHETYQIFADRTIHFDDREVLREAIETVGRGGAGVGGREGARRNGRGDGGKAHGR